MLAIGAPLAVILANICMQMFEGVIKDENDGMKHITKISCENVQNAAKNFSETVKMLNVKNVKIGFMLNVKTSVTTNTRK